MERLDRDYCCSLVLTLLLAIPENTGQRNTYGEEIPDDFSQHSVAREALASCDFGHDYTAHHLLLVQSHPRACICQQLECSLLLLQAQDETWNFC